ncbi:Putative Holliday junction resolvase YggF [hydrothermal vent metagenome]|uniref:Putative Holliday junction resolvase YggF n=1 Tax=hydrothermal vent metagenome TaxID=652676 RepID=A0A1W1C5W6_9ZZZZ
MIEVYLGFDVGIKKTGIALANSLTNVATGIDVMLHHDGIINWHQLDEIIEQYSPVKLIVGIPFKSDGSKQQMTFVARAFARKLKKRYQLDVFEIDEYLSSNEAKKQLKYNHHHKNANRIEVDRKASEIILQTWLNNS